MTTHRILLTVVAALFFAASPSAGENPPSLNGLWFSCEYAHSQIPPEDGCVMLDDDGFRVTDGAIDHVKVMDSHEAECRGARAGNCFPRTTDAITVSSSRIGRIKPAGDGFTVSYWGCTQAYRMQERQGYFEIAPSGSRCYWTREKRYFMARYQGRMRVSGD